jgi:hypothetical protein
MTAEAGQAEPLQRLGTIWESPALAAAPHGIVLLACARP